MKSPKPPDPYATAGAQQQANTGAAIGSSIIGNPNVYTPYGSQTYSIAGWEQVPDAQGRMISVPRYNQVQTLSPDQMRLMGLQTQSQYNLGQTAVEQSAKLRGLLGQAVNTEGLQGWGSGNPYSMSLRQDQAPTDRAGVEQAMMGRYNTDSARQNAAQQAQLAARGMNAGSSQYGTVADQQARARTDALQQAYLASGEESRNAQNAYNAVEQTRYNERMASAGYQNQLRQAQLQERLGLRNQPLNEISALLSGSQVTMPTFNPFQAQGIDSSNIAGLIGQNYATQSQRANAFNSGLFQLGSTVLGGAMMMSDRRMKQDIEPLDGDLAGVPLYHFRYRDDPEPQLGVMADEVKLLHPDAVIEIGGFDHVDYGLLLARHGGH